MDQLGPYRELTRIAVGGMAEVYRARDGRNGEWVALKIMLPHATRDDELRKSLLDEAQLQMQLAHPNLIAVRDYGMADGLAYIALEYVSGPTLATVLAERTRLSPAVALRIISDVLSALTHVHGARDEKGTPLDIVHRDISPQNIMLTSAGMVKLGDFGIARSRSAARTRTGFVKGKLGYLAPEQVTQSAVDARTDIYQVGLVLFEMLCGESYIRGDTDVALLRAAEAPEPRVASALGAPAWIDAPLARALKRFPEERYQSARQFAQALASLQQTAGEPDMSFLASFVTPSVDASRRAPTRQMLSVALGVIATAALAYGGLRLASSREEQGPPLAASASAPPLPEQERQTLPRQDDVLPQREPKVALEPASKPLEPVRKTATDAKARIPPAPDSKAAAVLEPAATPTAIDAPTAPPAPLAANEVENALDRLQKRTIAVADLPEPLARDLAVTRQRLAADSALPADESTHALCRALDALVVDRPFVERKLARLQSAITALPSDDPRRPELSRLSRATLQTLLDGNVNATNTGLLAIERVLRP